MHGVPASACAGWRTPPRGYKLILGRDPPPRHNDVTRKSRIPRRRQSSPTWPPKTVSGADLIPAVATVAPSGRDRSQAALSLLTEVNILSPVERVETSRIPQLGSEGWSTAWVVRVASYHASIACGAFLRAHNALTPCDQIGPLTAPRRPASGPLLATSFDRSAETSLLRPRHASREPSVPSREAGDGICPGAPVPATSKVGPSWACPYGARARLLPSQRRHRGTALPSGQVWGGRGPATPPRRRARAAEPAPEGPECSVSLVPA